MSGYELAEIENRYLINEKIGTGLHSEIYRAYDKEDKRHVAVKILRDSDEISNDQWTRYCKETEALSALNHPNIAKVHQAGQWRGFRYIVSEYQDGIMLAELKQQSLSLKYILRLMLGIAEGLSVAHRNNIIHGDLNISHIMITKLYTPKILDFGIEECYRTQQRKSKIYSNLYYMAPEIVQGKSPDKQSDLYALGVMLFELLASDSKRLVSKTSEHKNVLLSYISNKSFKYELPENLTILLTSCIADNPIERPSNADAFMNELESILNSIPEDPKSKLAFTHFYPSEMPKEAESTLHVYIHLQELLEAVQEDFFKRRKDARPNLTYTQISECEFKRGTVFKLVPTIEAAKVVPTSLEVEWIDDIEHVQFTIKPSSNLALGAGCAGSIRIFVGAGIVAQLPILFSTCQTAIDEFHEHTKLPYRKVFISYSHKDEAVVRAVERLYTKYPELDMFVDYRFLKGGEYWWNEVKQKIQEAEAIQLFWSENSSKSENVEREWRYALGLPRPIIPIMIKPEAEIPEQLKPIHFEPFEQFISGL